MNHFLPRYRDVLRMSITGKKLTEDRFLSYDDGGTKGSTVVGEQKRVSEFPRDDVAGSIFARGGRVHPSPFCHTLHSCRCKTYICALRSRKWMVQTKGNSWNFLQIRSPWHDIPTRRCLCTNPNLYTETCFSCN